MNIEDIKVGETYNVRICVTQLDCPRIIGRPVKQDGTPYGYGHNFFNYEESDAFSPINPYTPVEIFKTTEIPETAPKYDPNRKFRKGDKVHVKREVHGRPVYIGEDAWEPLDPSEIWTVVEEKETGWVYLKNGCLSADVWHGMLELVTPIEELEPYSVVDAHTHWDVAADKGMKTVATYSKGYHPNAKAAAEAECARLNDEWRKEQGNG